MTSPQAAPSACPRPVARTPLHWWHAAHGARLAESDGWQVPQAYSTAQAEIAAARAGLGIADISVFCKLLLTGPGVAALHQALRGETPPAGWPGAGINQGRGHEIGAVVHGVATIRESRAVQDHGPWWASRLTAARLLLLSSTTKADALAEWLAGVRRDHPVAERDVTSVYAGFCLVGPNIQRLLRQLTPLDVSPAGLPWASCAETVLAGVHALLVHVSELSAPSIRVYVDCDVAQYVWEILLEAGRDLGATPLGLEAFRGLRPRAERRGGGRGL